MHRKAQILRPPNQSHSQSKKGPYLLSCDGMGASSVSLLGNGELDTLALWQRNPWLLGADNEDVGLTGSEGVVYRILDVDNVEASVVTLTMSDNTDTSHVTTAGSHGNDTSIELDVVGDFASSKIDLDGIVDLDGWVWVTDSSCIVRDQEWDSALSKLNSLDFAQLVFGLLGLDSVDGEATLGIVDKTEVLAGLLDGDDIHEAGWEGGIGADLAINLDQALHDDSLDLTGVESIL